MKMLLMHANATLLKHDSKAKARPLPADSWKHISVNRSSFPETIEVEFGGNTEILTVFDEGDIEGGAPYFTPSALMRKWLTENLIVGQQYFVEPHLKNEKIVKVSYFLLKDFGANGNLEISSSKQKLLFVPHGYARHAFAGIVSYNSEESQDD
ncbi:MAG: hypothetical protein HC933_19030 [Pleurocapsa sp. SU_196_0]|nr:hypothetical protein [Pleurocapsa sp. SU_196_0]